MRHTSLRSAQYLQRGGLLWDTPPRDLHSNCQCFQALYLFRRWALRHTSARSAQFLQVFLCVGHVFFQFRRCAFRTPPRDLHSFYNNICVSEVCPTRDFIILNKGRMTPPWRERAKRSQGHAGFRILIRFLSRVGRGGGFDTSFPICIPLTWHCAEHGLEPDLGQNRYGLLSRTKKKPINPNDSVCLYLLFLCRAYSVAPCNHYNSFLLIIARTNADSECFSDKSLSLNWTTNPHQSVVDP